MPLVSITCIPAYRPVTKIGGGTAKQKSTEQLAADLPALLITHDVELQLDLGTPETGVQVIVSNPAFGPKDVNHPDVWLEITFSEKRPKKRQVRNAVRETLRQIILAWYATRGLDAPILAVDIFWGGSSGFLAMGVTSLNW